MAQMSPMQRELSLAAVPCTHSLARIPVIAAQARASHEGPVWDGVLAYASSMGASRQASAAPSGGELGLSTHQRHTMP